MTAQVECSHTNVAWGRQWRDLRDGQYIWCYEGTCLGCKAPMGKWTWDTAPLLDRPRRDPPRKKWWTRLGDLLLSRPSR